ncbi:MAG: DUF4145 domain-containing protein [Bacteroidales bacterium]|jgi:hypothetical protein|nr:DUF4145 domain-containing protein [Bacteroidales bacterium]
MIQLIPPKAFAQTSKVANTLLPASVDWYCPHCNRSVNFRLSWDIKSIPQPVIYCSSACSGCRKISVFIYVGFADSVLNPREGELYIHPEPSTRTPLNGIYESSKFNDGLKRAYESAINVYNVGEWTATAVLNRRMLEGIMKEILPLEKRNMPLAKQLEELPKHIDLQKPLITLAESLRKGGNLGAHFDLEKAPDENISTLMMDLLDYLIEYIYILPDRIDELDERVSSLSIR